MYLGHYHCRTALVGCGIHVAAAEVIFPVGWFPVFWSVQNVISGAVSLPSSYINCSITAVNFIIWPVVCTNLCAYFAVLPLVLWRKRAATGQSERPRFKLLKMHVDVKRSLKRSFKTEHWTLSQVSSFYVSALTLWVSLEGRHPAAKKPQRFVNRMRMSLCDSGWKSGLSCVDSVGVFVGAIEPWDDVVTCWFARGRRSTVLVEWVSFVNWLVVSLAHIRTVNDVDATRHVTTTYHYATPIWYQQHSSSSSLSLSVCVCVCVCVCIDVSLFPVPPHAARAIVVLVQAVRLLGRSRLTKPSRFFPTRCCCKAQHNVSYNIVGPSNWWVLLKFVGWPPRTTRR